MTSHDDDARHYRDGEIERAGGQFISCTNNETILHRIGDSSLSLFPAPRSDIAPEDAPLIDKAKNNSLRSNDLSIDQPRYAAHLKLGDTVMRSVCQSQGLHFSVCTEALVSDNGLLDCFG